MVHHFSNYKKARGYMFKGRDGPHLNQKLVYSNETHDVATGDIFNRLHISAHHQNGPGWREPGTQL